MKDSRGLLFVILLAVSSAGCGPDAAERPIPSPAPGKKVDAAAGGAVTGSVRFEGTPPAVETVRVSTDTQCVQDAGPNPQSDAVLVAADGSLRNVFVYVKDGLDADYTFDAVTTPAVLNQKGCFYSPRVLGLRVGQPIEIVNGDATLHNVHALPMINEEFNHSEPNQHDRYRTVFTAPEVMVRFKCDVHAWMAAYVGVLAHPYFTVSDERGQFQIPNLPAGSYTLEAWHERFGRTTARVTVEARTTVPVAFAFKAQAK